MPYLETKEELDHYFIDKAKQQIDDALTTLISDQGFSAEDIHKLLVQCVTELDDYFSKPARESAKLLSLIKGRSTEASKYDEVCEYLSASQSDQDSYQCEAEDPLLQMVKEHMLLPDDPQYVELKVDNGDITYSPERCVTAETYKFTIEAFREWSDLDIRQFPMTVSLYDSDGMDLLPADIAELWNEELIDRIVDEVNTKVMARYGLVLKDPNKLKVYKDNHVIPDLSREYAETSILTLFDLLCKIERWFSVQYMCILKAEKLVQSNTEVSEDTEVQAMMDELQQEIDNYIKFGAVPA
jgi:hypothetical protein